MEQTTPQKSAIPAKPVMDVTPPKPASAPVAAAPAAVPPVASTAIPAPEPSASPTPAEAKPAEAPQPEQGPLAVHQAPVDPDAKPDGTDNPEDKTATDGPKVDEPHAKAHLPHKVPKTAHTPAAIIAVTIMVMLILSGLAVLVYLNA